MKSFGMRVSSEGGWGVCSSSESLPSAAQTWSAKAAVAFGILHGSYIQSSLSSLCCGSLPLFVVGTVLHPDVSRHFTPPSKPAAADWTGAAVDTEDATLWQDDWDDDEIDDDFCKQLRAELEKVAKK